MSKNTGEKEKKPPEKMIKDQKERPVSPYLSPEAIDVLYGLGFQFYESGQYSKAMHYFRFLTLIDSLNRLHWIGLAASYQMQKEYERALQCWGQAALLDEKDPLVHWHAAECFVAIKKKEQALEALFSAESTAKRAPKKHHKLLEKIELLKTTTMR